MESMYMDVCQPTQGQSPIEMHGIQIGLASN